MKLNVLIPDLKDQQNISGIKDNNLKAIEEIFSCEVSLRGDSVYVNANECDVLILEELFTLLNEISKLNYVINERDIIYICNALKNGKKDDLLDLYIKPLTVGKKFGGKDIMPKTLNQKRYVKNLMNKDIIFGVGPAGTGKTYLAVMYAVSLLKEGSVKKIILTRPAVEAGESLGFLPGDLKEKVDPYLRPLYDALHDVLGTEHTQRLIERGVIEIAPLAYMRGRTLDNACIILDEATAMLDPNGRKDVLDAVKELNEKEGVTIILITHYMEEVIFADNVYVMDKGQVVMEGTPRQIFAQVEKLQEYRLDVPQVTLLAHELRQSGVKLPECILTKEELVDALCQLS